jgi:hypothetical protein
MTEQDFREWQRNEWKLTKRAYRAKKKIEREKQYAATQKT